MEWYLKNQFKKKCLVKSIINISNSNFNRKYNTKTFQNILKNIDEKLQKFFNIPKNSFNIQKEKLTHVEPEKNEIKLKHKIFENFNWHTKFLPYKEKEKNIKTINFKKNLEKLEKYLEKTTNTTKFDIAKVSDWKTGRSDSKLTFIENPKIREELLKFRGHSFLIRTINLKNEDEIVILEIQGITSKKGYADSFLTRIEYYTGETLDGPDNYITSQNTTMFIKCHKNVVEEILNKTKVKKETALNSLAQRYAKHQNDINQNLPQETFFKIVNSELSFSLDITKLTNFFENHPNEFNVVRYSIFVHDMRTDAYEQHTSQENFAKIKNNIFDYPIEKRKEILSKDEKFLKFLETKTSKPTSEMLAIIKNNSL